MSSAGGAEDVPSESPSAFSLARDEVAMPDDLNEEPAKNAALLAAVEVAADTKDPSDESLPYTAARFHGAPSEDLLLLSKESASSGVLALVLRPSSLENSPDNRDSIVPTIDFGRGFGATGGGGRPHFKAATVFGELPGVLS